MIKLFAMNIALFPVYAAIKTENQSLNPFLNIFYFVLFKKYRLITQTCLIIFVKTLDMAFQF